MDEQWPRQAHLNTLPASELGMVIADVAGELARRGDVMAVAVLARSTAHIGAALGRPRPRTLNSPRAESAAGNPLQAKAFAFRMHGICEAEPGPRWQALYEATGPAYRRWFNSEGSKMRPDLATSREMLATHMPELMTTWETMVGLADGDETTARMLTMWDPPKFLPGCSQAAPPGDTAFLVRNYDYSPKLFEQVCYSSRFTGRRVLGTSDCLWGLLDGINEDGLMVSLAFGGRPGSGPGFGIPLILRYLLETAANVHEASNRLARLPVSMSYNVTMTDSAGTCRTAFVAPGMAPEFRNDRIATNHRGEHPEYPGHAASLRSQERLAALKDLIRDSPTLEAVVARFLAAPLVNTEYSQGFGTLYTSLYRADDKTLEYFWPDGSWRRTFNSPDSTKDVVLWGT